MRLLTLYLRSRRVPAAMVTALGGITAMWALSLAADGPTSGRSLALLAAAIGTAAVGPGLVGADPALERTAALAWSPRRAAHVTVACAVVCGLLAATGVTGDPIVHSGMLIRDAIGLSGLVALGAAALGTGWAWLPGLAWVAFGTMLGPRAGHWYTELLTWTAQPAGTRSATVTAVLLAAGGGLAYATLGGRGRGRA